MTIYLASNNEHKRDEIKEILTGVELILPKEEGIAFSPDETGSSFFENAMIKALSLYRIVKKPVLSDDSGLCIDFLKGAPGIYSARYGAENGEHVSSLSGIDKVLEQMKGVKKRDAHFTCCMIFMLGENEFVSVQEICKGLISEKKEGSCGFGYDPIFYIKELNKTFAQLTSFEKNKISHRAKALQKLKRLFN